MGKAVEVITQNSREVSAASGGALTPTDMLAHALTSGASLDVIEKMMTLQERWEANQARKSFDDAMARLRQGMPAIIKDRQVDYTTSKGRTNYRYEDLNSVTAAISPVMAELGLSFRWRTDNNATGVKVTCVITHRDGHYEETSLSAPLDTSGNKNAIQAIGSATTYLQRYTLKAALGLSAAADDDGHGGPDQREDERSARQERQERQQTAPQQASKASNRDTYARLSAANRGLKTYNEWRAFWNDPANKADAEGLPADWGKELLKEHNEKRDELIKLEKAFIAEAEADPFGLPPTRTESVQAADAAPINPDVFLGDLRAEFAACDSLDALDEAWVLRAPEDALDFPPDVEKAKGLYVEHQRRLGRRV